MEPAKYSLCKEFDIVLSRWKKCRITKNGSFDVSIASDSGYFETVLQKSSDLVICQYSVITTLPFFLFPSFLSFKNIFEHQLCALSPKVMAGSKPDPGLLLIFSSVQQRRQVIKMELQCCVMSMIIQHVQEGKSVGTSLKFREVPLERLLPSLFYMFGIPSTFQNLRGIGFIRTVPHVSATLAGRYDLNPRN